MRRATSAVIAALATIAILVACDPRQETASPSPSPGASPPATSEPSPSTGLLTVPSVGEIWATLPRWFELPADATPVATTDQSASYTTSLDPEAAMAFVDHVLRPLDFNAELRDRGTDFEQASYNWRRSDDCDVLVVAHATSGGSRVDIRYPATCPH